MDEGKTLGELASITKFNSYQDNEVPTPSVNVIKQPSIKPLTKEDIEAQNNRRESILRLLFSGHNAIEAIENMYDKYGYDKDYVIQDIKALRKPEVFLTHRAMLKAKIANQIKKRNAAIYAHVDNNQNFDTDLLIQMSKDFQCSPEKIVSEIYSYMKFSSQLNKMKQQKKFIPHLSAATSFLRLYIRY